MGIRLKEPSTNREREMGIRLKEPSIEEASIVSSSPDKALILATMSIIGFPVEVHIKDGSVYSGDFFTASFENGYGVILKNAKMINKGTRTINMANGDLIDTLVVLPGDLVQVVAKGAALPSGGVLDAVGSQDAGAVANRVNHYRQDGVTRPQGQEDGRPVDEVQVSCTTSSVSKKQPDRNSSESRTSQNVKSDDHFSNSHPANGFPSNDTDSGNAVASKIPDTTSSVASSQVIPPITVVANGIVKESKLNPDAKIFSPSFTTLRSSTPQVMQNGANTAQFPSNTFPLIPPQQDVGIRPLMSRPSLPTKFLPYGNLGAVNSTNSFSYAQSASVPFPTRPQPGRYAGYLQQVQPGHLYPQPFSQNGMAGRQQLVYLQPSTHEMIQAAQAFSHSPNHPVLAPHPVHMQKLEGVVAIPSPPPPQMSVTPPLLANEQFPFAVPSPIPQQLPQPAPSSVWPVPVYSSHGPYGAKFL